MSFWRFLKYELPYIGLVAACFIVASLVYLTDPTMDWHWSTFLYALALLAFVAGAFFVYRYFKSLSAIRRIDSDDAEPLSLESAAYLEAMELMRKAHIHTLNEARFKQREHHDFIISWFHEIKTPISVLRLMQQTSVDKDSLAEELEKIEHYVDQALYYGKLDSFNQDYELHGCDLGALAKRAVKEHARTFIAKKLKAEVDTKPLTVQSDSKWLRFIVNQLITNSLKYTEPGGKITIETRESAKEKLLIVRDNGIGIESKDLPRVFNRGFTGTNGRTHMKSTGMGLYLAQQLANKLGHYLTCSSIAGEYTEFVIHFPKHHDLYAATVGRAPKREEGSD